MQNTFISPTKLGHHRSALLPTVQKIDTEEFFAILIEQGTNFLDFVLSQDLGPLWYHNLQQAGLLEQLPPATIEALRRARMLAAVGYLPQREVLKRVDALFTAQNIPYLVMKGVYVRECVYPDAALRPAEDIDIMISPQHRHCAARALLDNGYSIHVVPNNLSHEATFSLGLVDIDLHWHMQRPGRTRSDMTQGFLARRKRVNGVWGLSDNDVLFMMLVHPAINKYVCSPNMGLGRVADFLLWIQKKEVDWPAVARLLEAEGVKTAAWTMLSWFRMLAQPKAAKVIDIWLDTLRPGRLRAAYLRFWLTHDLPTRWLQRPFLIQAGFTLLMHDRLADVLHAVRGRLRAKRNQLQDARLLLGDDYQWKD
jgi:Uncharacterised nucleotidyltransferase